jgi:hypothetical protein
LRQRDELAALGVEVDGVLDTGKPAGLTPLQRMQLALLEVLADARELDARALDAFLDFACAALARQAAQRAWLERGDAA